LESLQLTSNFRSQSELVSNFNQIFDLLFLRPGDKRLLGSEGVDVPFVEANAVRERTGEAGVVWHAALLAKGDSRSDHAGQEARSIRRIIEERLAMPLPEERENPSQLRPWRIAVLGRAKNHLSAVIEEFKQDYGKGRFSIAPSILMRWTSCLKYWMRSR
jgi:ATP-dependent exoDNAse (exonuclease V) beta subunit